MTRTISPRRVAMMLAALGGLAIALVSLGNAASGSAPVASACMDGRDGVRWVRLSSMNERASLDRWCAGVGSPVLTDAATKHDALPSSFAVISWNTHVGGGRIDSFVTDLRSGALTGHPVTDFVLLLQEVYRAGPAVPSAGAVDWAGAEQPGGARVEVASAAQRLGLTAIYVPSMRNGRPGTTSEDRGNAILTTVPLSDITAIELPLERQRRVAIAATVRLRTADGAMQDVRVVCTHFTNMVLHHAWLWSESGRLRQARALRTALPPEGDLIVGGDLNAWFGYRDAAYKELAIGMSAAPAEDRRPTFGPMRLDHLLFRVPAGWREEVRRGKGKYGSDHYPLIALIDAP